MMKKHINDCFIFVLCVLVLFQFSCKNNKDNIYMNNIFFGEYVTDDLKTLDNLTKEYDLCELRCFFEGNHSNENIGFGPKNIEVSTLTNFIN